MLLPSLGFVVCGQCNNNTMSVKSQKALGKEKVMHETHYVHHCTQAIKQAVTLSQRTPWSRRASREEREEPSPFSSISPSEAPM